MKIKSKNGEELNFLESGVDGIYVLDHVAFKDKFDEGGNNDWEKSSGKKKLQYWAYQNLPNEIIDQFDVDIPALEEVFSQKMLNLYESTSKLESKQLPIFQNSDNRMMQFDGKPTWWWTKSNSGCLDGYVWYVSYDGSVSVSGVDFGEHNFSNGFVPVLRRKK